MHDDFAQRRRVALALAVTVILVPAAFLLNRGGDDAVADDSGGTLVGDVLIPGEPVGTDEATDTASRSDGTDPMGTTPPDLLEGTVPNQADDPATIAIPRPGRSVRGTATFSRSISDPTACQIRDLLTIPFSTEIIVTNLDNSQSVRCVVSVGGVAPDHDVVLNADAFLQIGDLTDTPLSVELSW